MKVYIVWSSGVFRDGEILMKIFTNKAAAEDYKTRLERRYRSSWIKYYVEEYGVEEEVNENLYIDE